MDITLLAALAAFICIIILAISFFFQSKKRDGEAQVQRNEPVRNNRAARNAPRRAQLQRNRGLRPQNNARQANEHDSGEDAEEDNQDEVKLPDTKMGAKKRAKMEAKAEKKAQREAEEHMRAERKKKESLEAEERKRQEEKERQEEKQREEEIRKAKEEKERQEHEEYLKMKAAFNIEEEGFEENDENNEENLLQEFVNYIKSHKVVIIENLAAHFKLKLQACIDRIKDLQQDDILTGVIDDRGKFIYVSKQEMDDVVKFIRQRGRVSIGELVDNSCNLINLSPTAVVN